MRYDDRTNKESLDADDAKVSSLLRGLRRVDTPANFDFKLKARIANATPSRTGSAGLFPVLKFAAPLLLLLPIVGFFITNGLFSSDQASIPEGNPANQLEPLEGFAIAEQAPLTPAGPGAKTTEISPAPLQTVERAAVSVNPKRRPRSRIAAIETQGRGSFDINLKQPNKVIDIEKPNVMSTTSPQPKSEPDSTDERKIVEVLSSLGADTGFVRGELKVSGIRASSTAERGGLQAGDVLKAIDGKPIDESTVLGKPLGARSLLVSRDGNDVLVVLQFK